MKRRLKRIYWISSILTLTMALTAMSLLLIMKVENTRESLRAILQASSAWTTVSHDGLQQLAESIADVSPPLRVTFLLSDGLVLADSEADPLSMVNHLSRPEVQQALVQPIGESLRLSDTRMSFSFYAAKKVNDLLILRLSYPFSEVMTLAGVYLALLGALFLALHLIQRYTVSRVAGRLMRQMEDVRELLQGVQKQPKAVYPEFQPVMDNIAYLAQRLNTDLEEVTRTARLRTDFVANASHELRSPLTSIMGFAEMLGEGMTEDPQEQAMCLKVIRSECQRMLDVIQDILLQSKTERPHDTPPAPVNVRTLAEEIIRALQPQADRRSITLSVSGEMSLESYEKDLWEILFNLTDNAIRYGRSGGYVRIVLEGKRFFVEDNGIGVAREHLPYLFEQFYRVDESREQGSGGTGLGLSIVKNLVQRCAGKITVESEHGKGSRFIVEFENA